MPTRLIREGLKTSERVDGLTAEEERFYTRLLLTVDDYGLFDARPSILRSALFPLRDDLTNVQIEAWLRGCVVAELVELYGVGGKQYLQCLDTRQRVRAKRAKFPMPPARDGHMTGMCRPESEAEAEAEAVKSTARRIAPRLGKKNGVRSLNPVVAKRSSEAKLDVSSSSPAITLPAAAPPAIIDGHFPEVGELGVGELTPLQAACRETWRRYSEAYAARWGAAPVRNQVSNAHIKAFCQLVPMAEAPDIAAFFCTHPKGLYASAKHDTALLRRDAAGLRTEWITQRPVTDAEVRRDEKTSARGAAFRELIEEARRLERG